MSNPDTTPRSPIELTVFNKTGGLLTKKIELIADKVVERRIGLHDGARPRQAGDARPRRRTGGADRTSELEPSHCARFVARRTCPTRSTSSPSARSPRGPVKSTVARTGENLVYRPGQAALVLFDYDMKGMPPSVALQLKVTGGFWAAMVAVAPALATAGYLLRLSTSAGLSRTDTGEEFPAVPAACTSTSRSGTAADAVRFLKTLHARCWLAGFGWMVVGAPGSCWNARSSTAWSARRSGWCLKGRRRSCRRCDRMQPRGSRRLSPATWSTRSRRVRR